MKSFRRTNKMCMKYLMHNKIRHSSLRANQHGMLPAGAQLFYTLIVIPQCFLINDVFGSKTCLPLRPRYFGITQRADTFHQSLGPSHRPYDITVVMYVPHIMLCYVPHNMLTHSTSHSVNHIGRTTSVLMLCMAFALQKPPHC
jgi:hypothetical protein